MGGVCGGPIGPADPNILALDHFESHRTIGEGGFGKVNAVVRVSDKTWYAMKTLDKERILSKNNIRMVFTERDTLIRIPVNPWVVNLHFCFQDEENLYVVMDLAVGGDLRYHLNHSPKRSLGVSTTRFYMFGCLLGLIEIHKVMVVHRDIKPDNLLVGEDGYPLITDLGVSKLMDENGIVIGRSGTSSYLAPEVFAAPHEHDTKIDIFALGITLFELIAGKKPFHKGVVRTYGKIAYKHISPMDGRVLTPPKGKQPTSPTNAQPEGKENTVESEAALPTPPPIPDMHEEKLQSVLEGMLHMDPKQRLSAEECIQHPFFAELKREDYVAKKLEVPLIPDKKKAYCEMHANDVMTVLGGTERRTSMRTATVSKPEDGGDNPFGKFDYNTDIQNPVQPAGKVTKRDE